jgi:TrpR family trp operon transcriptional repressor
MRYIEKEDEWNQLIKLFTNVKSEDLMEQMLHLLLTINEREFLVDRNKIVKALLTSESPQRQIAEDLGVSIAKITVGSNELKRTPPELISYFKKQVKNIDKKRK